MNTYCGCKSCRETFAHDVVECSRIVEAYQRTYRLPRIMRSLVQKMLPPYPPFEVGDKVCFHRRHEECQIRALFLSDDRKNWFVRVEEYPGSIPADEFVRA